MRKLYHREINNLAKGSILSATARVLLSLAAESILLTAVFLLNACNWLDVGALDSLLISYYLQSNPVDEWKS